MTKDRQMTILIAEDDVPSRNLLSKYLRQVGYAVIEAGDGQEAIQLALDKRPDLAILDMMMPVMSGSAVATALRQETDVPFIFLSANSEGSIVKAAVAGGALGYLVKPVILPQLVPAIEAALGRASDLERLRVAEHNLTTALAVGRETSIAVGILMERCRLNQEAAFNVLRSEARARRRKVSEFSEDLIKATELLNGIVPAVDSGPKKTP